MRSSEHDGGFTMVELLVAMGITAILMGLAAYALFAYQRSQALTAAAGQVLTDLRDAQVRAQAEVRTYRLDFDTATESYFIFQQVDPSDPLSYALVETRELDARSVDITSVVSDETPTTRIFFLPRGVSSNATIVIQSLRLSQDRQITLTGLTARAELR